jgi:hypothetical protein
MEAKIKRNLYGPENYKNYYDTLNEVEGKTRITFKSVTIIFRKIQDKITSNLLKNFLTHKKQCDAKCRYNSFSDLIPQLFPNKIGYSQ